MFDLAAILDSDKSKDSFKKSLTASKPGIFLGEAMYFFPKKKIIRIGFKDMKTESGILENGLSYHEQSFQMVELLREKGANINFVHLYYKLTPAHLSIE